MKEPAVLDSTCLIGLDQVGRLDLLPNLFDPVLIPFSDALKRKALLLAGE